MKKSLLFLLLIVTVAGCAAKKQEAPFIDLSAGAPDRAVIYPALYHHRNNAQSIENHAVAIIAVDGKRIVDNQISFKPVAIKPGQHTLQAIILTPGADLFTQKRQYDISLGELTVTLEANTHYLLKSEPVAFSEGKYGKAPTRYQYSMTPLTDPRAIVITSGTP